MTSLFYGTTILAVRRDGKVAMGGDGQVTMGDRIIKDDACKIRPLYDGTVLVGFAGATADAFALLEKFEGMLEKYEGNIKRSAIELGKQWRTDKILRRLEALLAVADRQTFLLLSGGGDVIEPADGIMAIGSGGTYALAAARVLLRHTKLSAKAIVTEALKTAASICIYTNANLHIEEL